ncbi:hypothetical protein XA68_11766 [Ophiocordyceps unilateralis]|uniref:Uncharacterized protein n=1 Tax=Ophiocordyceps unilateralis TaxID=268505 RepID=A0A2A9PF72_OPHUN|nr:hypothetical protein XA68_11766 [Ophiocordyceps unilateralis]
MFPLVVLLLLGSSLLPWTQAKLDLGATIARIDPSTTSCASSGECRTAAQAGALLSTSFSRHGVRCRQEAACLTALVLLETDHLKYQHNVYPGRPGQGTANMQMCRFNAEYAASDPVLRKCFPDVLPVGSDPNEDQCRRVLKCILDHEDKSFDTPAWFWDKKCPDKDARAKLSNGGIEGCAAYLKSCVGVDGNDQSRVALNRKAYDAFEVTNAKTCVPLDQDECQD